MGYPRARPSASTSARRAARRSRRGARVAVRSLRRDPWRSSRRARCANRRSLGLKVFVDRGDTQSCSPPRRRRRTCDLGPRPDGAVINEHGVVGCGRGDAHPREEPRRPTTIRYVPRQDDANFCTRCPRSDVRVVLDEVEVSFVRKAVVVPANPLDERARRALAPA